MTRADLFNAIEKIAPEYKIDKLVKMNKRQLGKLLHFLQDKLKK